MYNLSYVVLIFRMLKLNKDRSYTLYNKPSTNEPCVPCISPSKIPMYPKRLVNFEEWERLYENQLNDIIECLKNQLSSMQLHDTRIKINMSLWETMMKKKIYESSDNRFKNFMKAS